MKQILIIICITSTMFTSSIGFSQAITDTVVIRKKELSLNKSFHNSYKPDSTIVAYMSRYFVTDIISPTDIKNKTYKAQLNQKKNEIDTVRVLFIKKLRQIESTRKESLNRGIDMSKFEKYTITQIPVFYLTPNVVLFKNGENIAKYYNLETKRTKYLVTNGGIYLGIIDYYQGGVTLMRSGKNDSLGINEILKLGKTPIAFKNSIALDPNNVGGGLDMYGYLLNDHIVFSYYDSGIRITAGDKINKRTYEETYITELAESFFASGGSYPVLKQFIDREYRYLRTYGKQ